MCAVDIFDNLQPAEIWKRDFSTPGLEGKGALGVGLGPFLMNELNIRFMGSY